MQDIHNHILSKHWFSDRNVALSLELHVIFCIIVYKYTWDTNRYLKAMILRLQWQPPQVCGRGSIQDMTLKNTWSRLMADVSRMNIGASPQRNIATDKENKEPCNLDLKIWVWMHQTCQLLQWPILWFVSICRGFLLISSSNVWVSIQILFCFMLDSCG